MVSFVSVKEAKAIDSVVGLAEVIWHESYHDLSSLEQCNYMLNAFQSHKAIAKQIEEGMDYFLLFYQDQAIAYLALTIEDNCVLLSKVYILETMRQKGIFSQMLEFTKNYARKRNYNTLRLYVNKNNQAYSAYKARGFTKVGSLMKDIGSGYVMDDYCMELTVL